MYQIGDLVVYGSTGVCRVHELAQRELPGGEQKTYYTLKPLYQDGTIFAPVDTQVYMRPAITKDEAETLVLEIPLIEAEAYHSPKAQQLTEHYRAALQTHDCTELATLARSLYVKKRCAEREKRRFGQVDERFMRRAEELLFGELAAALGIPIEQVPGYIESRSAARSGEGTGRDD